MLTRFTNLVKCAAGEKRVLEVRVALAVDGVGVLSFRSRLIFVQKMMPDAVFLIGDHRAEIHVGDAFEDVCLDLRI